MHKAITAVAFGAVLSVTVCAAEEVWTGGVPDYFPEGTAVLYERAGLKKSAATTATFNYRVKLKLINGPYKNRVNIGCTGDGFAAADTNQFYRWADSNLKFRRGISSIANNMRAMRPHPRYDKFFNWIQVNLISPATGIPGPIQGQHDNDRLGWVNDALTYDLFHQAAASIGCDSIDWRIAILNLAGYYNSGGPVAVFSYENWDDIGCHEMGHGFHQLADEYFSCTGSDTREYGEINSTATVNSTKWLHWAGYVDVDPRVGQNPPWGCLGGSTPLGYYVGSRYVGSGQYRPTNNSKMNGTGHTPTSYNAICREKIIHDIYLNVKPIDTMFDTAGQKTDPDSLWVRVIDPAVLKVDWYVGTTLKKANGGTSIRRSEIATVPGTYTVRAHVYDEIIRHMNSSNTSPDTLDLVRQDTSRLVQNVQWNVRITTVAVSFGEMQKDAFRADVHGNAIVYGLRNAGAVTIDLYKIDGSLVKRVRLDGVAGQNTAAIGSVPSGMYLVSLKCADGAQVMKMNLTR